MVARAPLAAALFHAMHRGHRQPRAAHPQGMAERDRAAMRIDEIGIVLDAELAQDRRCPGEAKASLSSIKSKSLIFRPSRSISLRVAGTGPMPMMRGGTAGGGEAENARPRRQAVLFHGGFGRQDHRRGAVIDTGRVAGGHGAGIAHDRLQPGQAFQRGFGAADVRPCRPSSGPALPPGTDTGVISSAK